MSVNRQVADNASSIEINTELIPSWTQDVLSAATYRLLQNILKQPGGREALNEKIAKRKAAAAAK